MTSNFSLLQSAEGPLSLSWFAGSTDFFAVSPKTRLLMEISMFRKLSLVAVAAASLGGAALMPTPAAAWYGGYHHGWWVPRFYLGAPVSYGYGGCYVRQLLPTPWGPRWRLVNRCY